MLKRNLLVALFAILPAMASAENYSIGTGGQSGIYYPFGGALAKVWSENVPDVNAKAEVTAASVENTIKVVRGDMIAGIAMGNVVLDAYNGEGKFPKKMPVKTLFALYPNLVHTITLKDSGIDSLSQLKGKRVSLGAPASGTAVTSAALLESMGIDVKKDIDAVYLNYSETTNALANGQIDVGFIVGGQGVGAVTQIALTHDIKVLSISDEESANFPFFNCIHPYKIVCAKICSSFFKRTNKICDSVFSSSRYTISKIFHSHCLSHTTFFRKIPVVVIFAYLVSINPNTAQFLSQRFCKVTLA